MILEPVPFTPEHPLLKKHISYFYFLKTDNDDFEAKYYAFPHTDTVLNIHQKTNFEIRDYYTRVYPDAKVNYKACVQGIRQYPLLAHLQGKIDKVTILFKPMGINQFGVADFGRRYPSPSMIFSAWDSLPFYREFLDAFYANTDNAKRAGILENFLLRVFKPTDDAELMANAMDLLMRFEENTTIEQISAQLKVNVRGLNRTFHKHLGVSPVTFRKVARFRHSLESKIYQREIQRLTDIAYQSNYYDQAYFNKVYTALTGTSPQRFFNKINSLADDRLIFEFITK